jgi:hypothetical protein
MDRTDLEPYYRLLSEGCNSDFVTGENPETKWRLGGSPEATSSVLRREGLSHHHGATERVVGRTGCGLGPESRVWQQWSKSGVRPSAGRAVPTGAGGKYALAWPSVHWHFGLNPDAPALMRSA